MFSPRVARTARVARAAFARKAVAVLACALAALAPALAAPRPAPGPAALRVGSFNIRCVNPKDKGARSWNARRWDVADLISRMKCDIIGLQEVTPGQYHYLKEKIGERYGFVGEFRNKDRKSGEMAPVCYLKSRFELVKSGAFWLSTTPDKPGSRSWGTSLPRNCSYAVLKDRATGKSVCFANTHPDHKSAAARLNGAKLIAKRLAGASDGAPVVLVGDHNCDDDAAPAVFLRSVYDDSMFVTKTPPRGPWRSFCGWRKVEREVPATEALRLEPTDRAHGRGSRIDYIYVSKKGVSVLSYATIGLTRKGSGEFYSDHFPVVANIVLK